MNQGAFLTEGKLNDASTIERTQSRILEGERRVQGEESLFLVWESKRKLSRYQHQIVPRKKGPGLIGTGHRRGVLWLQFTISHPSA